MRNILHITTHMGGGVGKAISDTVLYDHNNQHKILILDKPQKNIFIEKCKDGNIDIVLEKDKIKIEQEIKKADVVIIHWWNHPMMAKLLLNFPIVKARYILWSHVSGCTYPNLDFSFLNRFKKILFTTPYSYENLSWTKEQREQIKKKSKVVYGLGKLEEKAEKKGYCIKNNEPKIGYVGTFTKSKISMNIVTICKKIISKIPNIKFIMLGDLEVANWILEEIKIEGIENNFEFLGYVKDVNPLLIQFDVFGYPLNSFHFGATENAILEAMMVGLPIVCFNQATEKYIIENKKNGLLASNIDEYVNAVITLCEDRELAKRLGMQARKDVQETYDLYSNIEQLQSAIEEILEEEKEEIEFEFDTLKKYFLTFVREQEKDFILECNQENLECLWNNYPIFCEKNKSSLLQFCEYFPEDEWLKEWKEAIIQYDNK